MLSSPTGDNFITVEQAVNIPLLCSFYLSESIMTAIRKIKIGIIDTVGLPFDGSSLAKKGLGGSESAVISMSRELTKIGFDVTVLNDCTRDNCSPGTYDGVAYYPLSSLASINFEFDIVISQRAVTPFAPREYWARTQRPAPYNLDQKYYDQVQRPDQLKILWMHDTFCWGDEVLEELVVNKYIDEIFTLSDWHTSYILHAQHGPRRMPEVLKHRIFQTRSGINSYIPEVDITKKDPDRYVFNASVNKGMIPLLEYVWPRFQLAVPEARLTVIGGYYQYPNTEPDESVRKVLEFQERYKYDSRVTFTGIITQDEIAKIYANASYTIYPATFPETSGISTLESIYYNTPIIGCRFGAMSETGTELAGYYLDYAVEPNQLFPDINRQQQLDRFVELAIQVRHNSYLHQQRQYSCNRIREIATWDTVALQWKQHFYHRFNINLDSDEEARVAWVNHRVHEVFGRQWTNPEEITAVEPQIPADPITTKITKLAIVDIPGMSYDGNTINERGLGGSESAVVSIARELSKIGFEVTVYNGCNEDGCQPGIYDSVIYRPYSDMPHAPEYDVVIASRTPVLFTDWRQNGHDFRNTRTLPQEYFLPFQNAQLKVLWMHDTFSWGDEVIESMVLNQQINEVWTLSDFHRYYFMNCNHGTPRNFEVLDRFVWQTRNGINRYSDQIDFLNKDPDLFVFNANISKGLRPLLNLVWPKVQERIPQAKLIVIGGFYNLGSAFSGHTQDQEFEDLVSQHRDNTSISFVGIVTQRVVAQIMRKASYFLYPVELPETFGISAWESLAAGTPLITCRFGALEETATDASWRIDYPVVPNIVFPNINTEEQVNKFVNLVVQAYQDLAGLANRQNIAQRIANIAGWDTVALEWKQHIYQRLNLYLGPGETQRALYSTRKYQRLTGRRITNRDFFAVPKLDHEQRIVIISTFRNAAMYLERCILSVAAQNYSNYHHYLINDASTDNSSEIVEQIVSQLPTDLNNRFTLIENEISVGAVQNQVELIRKLNDNDVIMLLDGDDWLANRSDLFDYYNWIYQNDAEFVYGSSWSEADKIPLISQPYPKSIQQSKSYRHHRFTWGLPYTHLRSFKKHLINKVSDSEFKDSNGQWYRAGGDGAVFYNLLEQADPDRVHVVSDVVYHYNDLNPLNDYKVNGEEQNQTARAIVQQQNKIEKKKIKRILIAIPTAKYIEPETFKSIYSQEIPEGYETVFQYFFGYRIDQVRNLIADWVINGGFDYLWAVDSDITFPPDTLKKLLSQNAPMISAVYRQRIAQQEIIELYKPNGAGGVVNMSWDELRNRGIVEIAATGFGCVLINSEVFKKIKYPHFEYHVALDHNNTVSEDTDFCSKARAAGFQIFADTSILCGHIGQFDYRINQ